MGKKKRIGSLFWLADFRGIGTLPPKGNKGAGQQSISAEPGLQATHRALKQQLGVLIQKAERYFHAFRKKTHGSAHRWPFGKIDGFPWYMEQNPSKPVEPSGTHLFLAKLTDQKDAYDKQSLYNNPGGHLQATARGVVSKGRCRLQGSDVGDQYMSINPLHLRRKKIGSPNKRPPPLHTQTNPGLFQRLVTTGRPHGNAKPHPLAKPAASAAVAPASWMASSRARSCRVVFFDAGPVRRAREAWLFKPSAKSDSLFVGLVENPT